MHDLHTGRWNKLDVAVKTLKVGTMTDEDFLQEAATMKRCNDKNLVRVRTMRVFWAYVLYVKYK